MIKEAQELSVKHKLFWLAASLLGHSDPYYDFLQSEKRGK
jgi:hypothetical protein